MDALKSIVLRGVPPPPALAISFVLALLSITVSLLPIGSSAAQHGEKPSIAGHPADRHNPADPHNDLVDEAQQRLFSLGYWDGQANGVFDHEDRAALIAFQQVEGRQKTGRASLGEVKALRSARAPIPVETGYPHVEVDLRRQILFFVNASGEVSRILPVSTGSGKLFTSEGRTRRATTPTGKFVVERKIAGWHRSPLGLLYYPNYISGGIAIHGNPSVPAYPASHGCIRIPMSAAKQFSELTPVGTPVIVHR